MIPSPGAQPSGAQPSGAQPSGAQPSGSQPPGAQPGPQRRRGLLRAGVVLAVLGLVCAVACGVVFVLRAGSPMVQALGASSYPTPMDRTLSLDAGDYLVYERTGRQTGGGGVQFRENHSTTLIRSDVTVHGADGQSLEIRYPGPVTQNLTRDGDIYTGAVRFTVPAKGLYRVVVDSGQRLQVIVAPSLGSGLSGVGWLLAGMGAGAVTLVVGLILLMVGLLSGRQRAVPVTSSAGSVGAGAGVGAQPAPGWYPDPQVPQQWRYWDGRQWGPPGPR
ncbi:MAG TPA: DUF2510 domain-containing protein [Kineosporiaceae bacterium]|nr:DUF2510 domain-containing protein [Kineosporiaceae bacterium]